MANSCVDGHIFILEFHMVKISDCVVEAVGQCLVGYKSSNSCKEGFRSAGISYRKGMQHRSIESIQDADHSSVAGNEDLLPVVAEFDSGPFADTAESGLEGSKGTL